MTKLQMYCSQKHEKVAFKPIRKDEVRMYVCGPTVYSTPHIGNARPCVVFDTWFRMLQLLYKKVIYCRNITDVDDKINQAAQVEGVDIHVIADRYTKAYHQDAQALGCLPPTLEPRATDHMKPMQDMIQALIGKGYAYQSQGHVLFLVPSYADYGSLSHRNQDARIAGSRVEVADYKKHPEDFVLWKPSSEHEPGWESPWGRGRPGWHIECTAMIEKHLGLPFDIHGGGGDLLFPHHENECAQGRCFADSSTYCNYWLHNGMISLKDEKMSKSLGNILSVRTLLDRVPGEAVRLALLQTHYRSPLAWSEEALDVAKSILDRAYRALLHLQSVPLLDDAPMRWKDVPTDIQNALLDDLNTPLAICHWQQLVKQAMQVDVSDKSAATLIKKQLLATQQVLGLGQQTADTWFHTLKHIDVHRIEALIRQRAVARAAGDYASADQIRNDLLAEDIVIEDKAGKTTWRAR